MCIRDRLYDQAIVIENGGDYVCGELDPVKFAELIIKDQQRPWVGLTDEEIKEIWLTGIDRGDDWLDVQGIARSIEAKLKEKNT